MKEEFLHYIWKYMLFDHDSLFDNDGNRIEIIHPGEYNRDSGPDFFNARILTGGIEWAGNVEIHCRSSHFDTHGHNNDHAFDNVVLHAVAENDKRVFNAKGEEILTVRLKFDESLYERYLELVNNPAIIACQNEINSIEGFIIRQWLYSAAIERLESKTESVMKVFRETGNDWEETFYRILIRYFGFRVNTEPFEMLANSLPFRIIRKHADNRFQIEALLFGTAGMLEERIFKESLSDQYYSGLVREYKILSSKYSLKPLHGWIWKFHRLRPVNFPTVRLSQLAAMLSVTGGLFSRAAEIEDIKQLRRVFEVTASSYWDDHYIFGRKSRTFSKKTGSQATDILLINAVIPVIYLYGSIRDRREICERALFFLESLPSEQNRIVHEWIEIGIKPESALFSQALIHLRNEYCRKRRCLECRIGSRLIRTGKTLNDFKNLILEP